MRTLSRCLILAVLFSAAALARDAAAQDAGIKAYIVVDDKTGHILSEKDATKKYQVASLTKIATAIVAFDWAKLPGHGLDPLVTITAADITAAGGVNPIGFQAGDQASLRDLLYAALLQSDNVAAEAIAGHVGRQLRSSAAGDGAQLSGTTLFVAQMNALARSLSMERTRFLNPTGIDSKEQPFSTAADMARLTRLALGKADFRFFVAQKERRISIKHPAPPAPAVPVGDPEVPASAPGAPVPTYSPPPVPTVFNAAPTPPPPTDYLLRNTNELLGVNNVDGVKTGQTTRAGSCLIITAARESLVAKQGEQVILTPRRIIVVVLGANDRFREASGLLARGINLYDQWAAQGRPLNAKENL